MNRLETLVAATLLALTPFAFIAGGLIILIVIVVLFEPRLT